MKLISNLSGRSSGGLLVSYVKVQHHPVKHHCRIKKKTIENSWKSKSGKMKNEAKVQEKGKNWNLNNSLRMGICKARTFEGVQSSTRRWISPLFFLSAFLSHKSSVIVNWSKSVVECECSIHWFLPSPSFLNEQMIWWCETKEQARSQWDSLRF